MKYSFIMKYILNMKYNFMMNPSIRNYIQKRNVLSIVRFRGFLLFLFFRFFRTG